jgi:hypothetical protein
MADVNTYSRCIMPHYSVGSVHTEGEVRPNADAAVTLNPQWWIALSDSVMTSGSTEVDV